MTDERHRRASMRVYI